MEGLFKISICCRCLLLLSTVFQVNAQADLPPDFIQPHDPSFSADENTPAGEILTMVEARDPENGPITFSLSVDDFFKLQNVGPNRAQILFAQNLDYEDKTTISFRVTAEDDSSSKSYKDITVTVNDLNDNVPQFVGNNHWTLSETTRKGHVIENAFYITDADTGKNAELTINCFVDTNNTQGMMQMTQKSCETFSLSTTRNSNGNYSVNIEVDKDLDYEDINNYIMAVRVQDGVEPINSNSRNLVIQIEDAQDQGPRFIGDPYSFFPYEELTVGSNIEGAVIRYYDGDRGYAPRRNLTLELLNDTRGWLGLTDQVSDDKGEYSSNLTVASRMDRERYFNNSIYTVRVRVSELREDGSVDTNAVETTTLTINLLDINDNEPLFYTGIDRSQLVTQPIELSIDENLGVNTPLPGFLLSVQDTDSEINQFNVRLEGAGADTFQLSPSAGTSSAVLSLSVRKPANIDYEKPEFRDMDLTIVATERSENPKYENEVQIKLHLVDKNDNSPQFLTGRYDANITSETTVGSIIANPQAVDADSGENGAITYSLGQPSSIFSINPTFGNVTLLQPVSDADTIELELVATDGGGRSSTATLVISVKDDNAIPPAFDSHIYNASVIENRDVFLQDLQVNAAWQAYDPDNSGPLTYRIVSGNTPDNVFVLQSVSGRLTLRRPLTKEDGRQFNLTIEVSDGGDNPLTDRASIIIDLLDSNDYTPTFPSTNFTKNVSELTPVGAFLLNLTAVDEDGPEEAGGRIKYTILSGDNTQRFSLDPNTGILTLNAELDFNIQSRYILQVEAKDGGEPSRLSVISVYITVIDENNKLPKFPSDLYIQYMNENDPAGTRVLTVQADDLDTNKRLIYQIDTESYKARDPASRDVFSISQFNYKNAFQINSETGEITTRIEFNRDAVSFIEFRVIATDLNANRPPVQKGNAVVQVYIRQQGLGYPEFLNKPWSPTNFNIDVNVTEGTYGHIFTLIAQDSYTKELITRFEEDSSGDAENLFTVDQNGLLRLLRPLDYEDPSQRSKTLVVKAISPTGQESIAVVRVTVQNINDNNPYFNRESYNMTVSEGIINADRRIGTVSATDPDGDLTLRYSITGRYSQYFYVITDRNTNQAYVYIRNNTILDAEQDRSYTLFVNVADQNGTGRSSQTSLTVNIDNVNEHTPVCEEQVSHMFIQRNLIPPSDIGTVSAYDADVGDTLRYELDRLDENKFVIDQRGRLRLAVPASQLSDSGIYSLPVYVRDSELRSTTCNVTIYITADDNQPRFTNPPTDGFTYNITEGSAVNTSITQFRVINSDNSPATNSRFYLSNYTRNDVLYVNPNTGRVYITRVPDRENISSYEMIVIANTDGDQISRRFIVNITDIDDNFPSFTSCQNLSYPLVLQAHQLTNSQVLSNTDFQSVGVIKACDNDQYPNNVIYYHLVDCEDGSTTSGVRTWYTLNVTSGQLSVRSRFLDNTVLPRHTLCVNASTSPTDASIQSDQWKIVVDVKSGGGLDVRFLRETVSVLMSNQVGANEDLLQVGVVSRTGTVSVTYNIESITYIRGDITRRLQDAFIIDELTGKITTNYDKYENYLGGKFIVNVTVTGRDSNGNTESDSMTVNVNINSPEEQLILVFDRAPEEVRKILPEFFTEMERIHGYQFITQKITYHQDPISKQTNLNKTDVWFYALYKNGTVVPAERITEIMRADYNSDQQKLWIKYNLSGNAKPIVTAASSSSNSYAWWNGWEWLWWVIIVSALFLIIDAIILICCVYYFWNKHVLKPSAMVPVYYHVEQ